MVSANIRFFQLMRFNYNTYLAVLKSFNAPYAFDYSSQDATWTVKNISSSVATNNKLNLLRSPDIYEMSKQINRYLDILLPAFLLLLLYNKIHISLLALI